jgi:hypothetical protein
MNDDDFEKKLLALTGALHRPDPTSRWKEDILARARREADSIPLKRSLPPRWLMLSWATAWMAIFAFHLTQPSATKPNAESIVSAKPSVKPASPPLTLIAFHQQLNFNLDQP